MQVKRGFMYLRKAKTKNGRIYLSIVQAYRDQAGKAKAKTIKSLGYVDELTSQGISDPIAHFEQECALLNEQAAIDNASVTIDFYPHQKIDMREVSRVELGACIPSAYFHRDLGIFSFFEKKRTARKFDYDPCRILELLVWDRIAHPSSKKAAFENKSVFPRKCSFTEADMYRCLSYFDENCDALVKSMNASLERNRGPRNKTRLYYDVTNYYFEIENEDGFRMRGVSKEHRPNPIVQMGLLLDGDALPLDFEIFSGNTGDMQTMMPVMKKAGLRNLDKDERVILVADKGLNTSSNIAACILDGNGFIISQSVRRAPETLKTWVLDESEYITNESLSFKIKSRISEKIITVCGQDGKKHKVSVPVKELAFWSRDYFERSRYERAKVIEKSSRAIEKNEMYSYGAKTALRYTKDVPVNKTTGEVASHNWILDEQKIEQDEQVDGYYCIITSELDMDDKEIIEAYRGLWRIEESFRVMKSDFEARPVYCSTQQHIRAHFLICYVALVIMRLMQLDTNWHYSASEIANSLKEVVGHRMDKNYYLFDYRNEITDKLSSIVGVDLSRQILAKNQIRQIMASVKKPLDE